MMESLRQAIARVKAYFGKEPLDRELDDEVSIHLALAIEENVGRGMTAEEARRKALMRFGGLACAREVHRETRGLPLLDVFMQDLRYSLRTLRRDYVFACVVILILGVGIGANVTVFSLVNAILVRPLPFRNPQQLVWFASNKGKGGLSYQTYTADAFERFREHNQSFQDVTSYQTFFNSIQYKLIGEAQPLPLSVIEAAENFFPMLGVQPGLGRLFSHEECQKNGRPVALLTYPFWQSQFAGDSAVIGRTITISDKSVTIVGVLPRTFDFGSVFSPGRRVDIFVPAVMDFWRTWGNTLALIGRLKPGISVGQAQAEADVLFPQLKNTYHWWGDYLSQFTELKDYISGKLKTSLIVLWCAVGLTLLIVCVNLSNLLLARSAARSKEFAMRRALGAGRGRILQQLVTEGLVLSTAGALLGIGGAFGITTYLARQGSIALPMLSTLRVDGVSLAWAAAISVTAALLFSLAPAFKASDTRLQEVLKDAGHGMSQGRRHERLRATLVISEVALACVLLIGAGLLVRSFLRVLDVDLGFQPASAAAIEIDWNDGGNSARRGVIFHNIVDRVSSLPGIDSAGIVDMLPLDRHRSWGFQAKGRTYLPGDPEGALVYVMTPGYLRSMGMRLREGRDFSWNDLATKEPVVVINEAAARLHWQGRDALGQIARINNSDVRVIGIISDVRESSLEEVSSPEMYVSATREGPEGGTLVVRTRLRPEALQSSVMNALRSLNPSQPATEFRSLQKIVDQSVSPRRFFVVLISSFAAMGLILAALGIYGVIAYSVSQRTVEIGIRMALGANQGRVRLGVMGRALRFAFIGIGVGLVGSIAVAKIIASLLYETKPGDPLAFLATILSLSAVALIAAYIPARRASKIQPISALRGN